jgi:acyl transferase domain-containing protein
LVHLLRDWGIEPSAVVGHSSGEIAAAFAAGALTFESALSVAYFRGKVVSTNPKSRQLPEGAMLAVGASAEEVSPLVDGLKEGNANIACYNSAKSVTVAGDKSAIVELNDSLNAQGVFNRILKTERAYHSGKSVRDCDCRAWH